jgi:hypothetical protein
VRRSLSSTRFFTRFGSEIFRDPAWRIFNAQERNARGGPRVGETFRAGFETTNVLRSYSFAIMAIARSKIVTHAANDVSMLP